jgi:glycosyltransferase involved in cell wall biosynthesis
MLKDKSRNLRICLVSDSFLPTIGGAELAVHHLANAMSVAGNEVVVFTSRKKEKQEFVVDYMIKYYPRMPRGYLQGYVFALFLVLIQRKYKFDLIHIHKAEMGYYAIKSKGMLKVPIIITTHGGDIQVFPEIKYGIRLDPVWNKRIEYAVRNADLLTAISTATKKQYSVIGACPERVVDIPNGVVLARFNDPYSDIRNLLGFPRHTRLLLSVGRFHPVKGYEYLIKSMVEIITYFKDVKCLIVGRGLEILKPIIRDLQVENHITLLDQQFLNKAKHNDKLDWARIPDDILVSLYKSSDIYVSSSLIEGFSLTVVEAMAAGLPIIATNVPGNEDAVADGKNGLLVKAKSPKALSEAAIQLLKNDSLRTRMGKNSITMSKKYDWSIIAEKYIEAYDFATQNYKA